MKKKKIDMVVCGGSRGNRRVMREGGRDNEGRGGEKGDEGGREGERGERGG